MRTIHFEWNAAAAAAAAVAAAAAAFLVGFLFGRFVAGGRDVEPLPLPFFLLVFASSCFDDDDRFFSRFIVLVYVLFCFVLGSFSWGRLGERNSADTTFRTRIAHRGKTNATLPLKKTLVRVCVCVCVCRCVCGEVADVVPQNNDEFLVGHSSPFLFALQQTFQMIRGRDNGYLKKIKTRFRLGKA